MYNIFRITRFMGHMFFENFHQHFYPWSFPSLLAPVGVTIEKGLHWLPKATIANLLLQRGVAPWSRMAPLKPGVSRATASPGTPRPPSGWTKWVHHPLTPLWVSMSFYLYNSYWSRETLASDWSRVCTCMLVLVGKSQYPWAALC